MTDLEKILHSLPVGDAHEGFMRDRPGRVVIIDGRPVLVTVKDGEEGK